MKKLHLIIPDLFLPTDFAAEVCSGLVLPALQKILARGRGENGAAIPLENHLSALFGMPASPDAPIAPIAATFDGLQTDISSETGWLCVSPAHLRLQRDQVLLLPVPDIQADEAVQFCRALNEYFDGQGMVFDAPHPQRWYVRLDKLPEMNSLPLSQVSGRNIHGLLPKGADATRWYQIFNDIQMLLFAHPLNELREERGMLSVNGVWLWGGGAMCATLTQPYDCVSSDDVLATMLAKHSGVGFSGWMKRWQLEASCNRQLLVWTGLRQALQQGDLGTWREALLDFEVGYAQPIWQALRNGGLAQLRFDVLSGNGTRCTELTRADTWALWRRNRALDQYAIV